MADRSGSGETLWISAASALVGVGAVTWLGGVLAQLVVSLTVHRASATAGLRSLAQPGDPGRAWHTSVGPPILYWTLVGLVAVGAGTTAWALRQWLPGGGQSARGGLAGRRETEKAAGGGALLRRASSLRPQVADARLDELGFVLGRSDRGVACWASVEDSLVVLGPPRAGKGLHLVIPAILDAPGAVVTTSTRPDNLAATLASRRRRGPIAVFDPQGLAQGIGDVVRWSPLRGCETPRVAIARAEALCAGGSDGVENASFWSQQSRIAVRCLLHAAALEGREPVDVLRWSLSPNAADEAAQILLRHPRAAPTWATALDAILGADPRQRDSVWAMVTNAFAALSDPQVLDAVTPRRGETFDPRDFLRRSGTLYLLGTAAGAAATATLVTALLEDITETARSMAAAMPRARLDPPLAVILDEAANYPLPSLLPLMSEGGGSGLSTLVVLQSLAQARARWGRDETSALWDSAILKIVLGGSANAEDLRDLSALLGSFEAERTSRSKGETGRTSTSTSVQDRPVLEVGDLRTLPFGTAMLIARAAPPIRLKLRPWTARRDAGSINESRDAVEASLRAAAEDRNRG